MAVLRRHRYALAFSILILILLLFCAANRGAREPGGPSRRTLVGPGSAPPSCRSRCGRCSPCTAVHVPIQPGFSFPLEYYPEAWRCKCRNQLFMP